jgi:hypothetical protein
MPEIPRAVIKHKLGIDLSYKPIKQKKEDIHQRGKKPSSKKLINYSKPGSSGQ